MKNHAKVTSSVYIVIKLIANCIAYWLPGLFNEYLELSEVNGFLAAFSKTVNYVGKPLDCHLKKPGERLV